MPGSRQRSGGQTGTGKRIWEITTAFFAVVAVAVAIYAIRDQQHNTKVLADTIKQLDTTKQQLQKAQADIRAISKISPEQFLYDYQTYLADIETALQNYHSAQQLVESDRAGAVAAAQKDLFAAVAAFTTFITQWRVVAEQLQALLDGNVTRMAEARRFDNAGDVRSAAETIIRTFPSLQPALQLELEKLKQESGPGNG